MDCSTATFYGNNIIHTQKSPTVRLNQLSPLFTETPPARNEPINQSPQNTGDIQCGTWSTYLHCAILARLALDKVVTRVKSKPL